MKIALCLSGLPRYLDDGYKQIYNNILIKNDIDVFVHTWWDTNMIGAKQHLSYNRNFVYDENILDKINSYYNPKILMNEPQQIFNTFKDVDYETLNDQSVFSMLYSIKKSNELKCLYEISRNFKYDIVIRCRFDIKFINFKISLESFNLGKLNCYFSNNNFINDQFAISSSDIMDIYSNAFDFLYIYKENGFKSFIGEKILTHHLKSNNIDINFDGYDILSNDIIKGNGY